MRETFESTPPLPEDADVQLEHSGHFEERIVTPGLNPSIENLERTESVKSIYHATTKDVWGGKIPSEDIVLKGNLFGWIKPSATFMLGAARVIRENPNDNERRDILNRGFFIKVFASDDEIKMAPDRYVEKGKTLKFLGNQGTHAWESSYGNHEVPIIVFATERALEMSTNANKRLPNDDKLKPAAIRLSEEEELIKVRRALNKVMEEDIERAKLRENYERGVSGNLENPTQQEIRVVPRAKNVWTRITSWFK